MGVLRWVKSHRKTSASAGIVTTLAVALGVMAFTYEGFTTTDVDLNDGGVWVTKTDDLLLGHLNFQAQELDNGLSAPTQSFDVLQSGDDVLLHNQEANALVAVDPALMQTGAATALPGGAVPALGGDTVAILDADGDLWAFPFDELGSFDPESTDPLAELGDGAAVTVGLDGSVHAVSQEDPAFHTWEASSGGLGDETVDERQELADAGELTITAVGDEAVALDAESGTLYLESGSADVPKDAVLQQPGSASDRVVLTTGDELVSQPLAGGNAATQRFGSGGEGVAPVQIDGCIYAVWPSTREYVRDCGGSDRDFQQQVEGLEGTDVVFRVNRGIVALNQVADGNSWILTDQLVLVDNWEDLVPPESEEESDEQDDSTEDIVTDVPPPPSAENHDPIAVDDQFGARPGRATILPVLANDSDEDGDVLTASVVGDLPSGVTIAPVTNDSQLQVELQPDVTESFTFRYAVADGQGGSAEASVSVSVRGPGENSGPDELRDERFEVEVGATVEYNVLQNWVDPDGDDMYLADAVSENGDTIQFSPAGRIVYTATGLPGITTIDITLTDGTEQSTGTIDVDVRERGAGTVQANADFVSTVVGQDVTITPLDNDYVPSGQSPRLASVESSDPAVTVTPDYGTGAVQITGATVGQFYLTYTLASGISSDTGRIRVDIRELDDEARPVAVRDVALLPAQGEAVVDLLANDVDPSGGVLVVTSIDVGGTPVTVELLERRTLRILDNRGLTGPATISYSVSNGRFTETGQVVIFPVEPPAQARPPVAVADQAVVREGDFATVDIIGNDFSPDSQPFSIAPELVSSTLAGPEEGVAFVDGDTLRVHVLEGGPSNVTVTYEVLDEHGARNSATVEITVQPRGDQNSAPSPETVTARAIAGGTVRIPIPLDGIDPDGDGVLLVGEDGAPSTGRIVGHGPNYFDFEAFDSSSGTVTFTYRVRDRWGAEGTAQVRIGIAQPSEVNHPPFAETDSLTVRPGRALAIPVLTNDSDPDGDALTLVEDGLDLEEGGLDDAEVDPEHDTVQLTTPEEPGTYSLMYQAMDARGMAATGMVVVTVAEEAPLAPPQGVDDVVEAKDAVIGEPLDVPVLDNDLDADGDPAELDVSVVTGEGRVVAGGVQVVPTDEFQVVTYEVTDVDGQSAEAFVFVPAATEQLPRLITTDPIIVDSGVRTEIPLRDYVWVGSSNPPRITTSETVSATNANGDDLVIDEQTLQYTSEASYVGEAAISFQVTDGTAADDPEGNVTRLTIPITVMPSSAVAPTFAGAVIQVEAGEDATRYQLTQATKDPDQGDLANMAYSLDGGAADGITAGVEGQEFVASAGSSTPPGSRGTYNLTIRDPGGSTVEGQVVVEVVASTRPLATAGTDVADGVQGIAQTIDVLTNDVNPFQNRGEPLIVESVAVVSGATDGAPTTNGTSVSFTPGSDFAGLLTLSYTLQDATQQVSRTVTGTIQVTVKGAPEAPIRPNVLAVADQTVTLSWAAPYDNGAPISGYLVRSSAGTEQQCASTTCDITGLTNNVTYTFTITAVNEIGESDPSPTSSEARPDVKPERPGAPSAERGDTRLTVSWAAPVNNGSPITSYDLIISPPAPGGATSVQVQGTSYVWEGLTNGTAYTFSVIAHNSALEPSDQSPQSVATIPAGPPLQVQQVTAARISNLSAVQMTVSWAAANPNGDAVQGYTVNAYVNGALQSSIAAGAGQTSATFEGTVDGSNTARTYTFTVVAANNVGSSPESAQSAGIRAVTNPGAPSNVALVSDGDGFSTISYSPGAGNGATAAEQQVQYSVDGGTWRALPASNQVAASNASHTVALRTVATVDGQQYASGQSNGASIAPFGPIGSPTVRAKAVPGGVDFTWSSPAANGRALTVEYSINGGGWVAASASGTLPQTGGQGSTITMQVRVTSAANGQAGAPSPQQTTASDSASVPNPSLTLSGGALVDLPNQGGVQGRNFVLAWSGLPAVTYAYECHASGGNFRSGSWTAPSTSGSTPSNQYTFCGNSDGGPYELWLTANGTTYKVGGTWTPTP